MQRQYAGTPAWGARTPPGVLPRWWGHQQHVSSSEGAHKAGTECLLQEGCAPRGARTAVEEGQLVAVSVCMCVGGIRTLGD